MICPNCNSNIPDDSRFCPDCGNPVKDINALRSKAKNIKYRYTKGYNYFAKRNELPHNVNTLSVEECETIITRKDDIVQKNRELEQKEQRRRQEEQLRRQEEEQKFEEECKERERTRQVREQYQGEDVIHNKARSIVNKYKDGYKHFVEIGELPLYSVYSNIEDCCAIIAKEEDIKSMDDALNPVFLDSSSSYTSYSSSGIDWGELWAKCEEAGEVGFGLAWVGVMVWIFAGVETLESLLLLTLLPFIIGFVGMIWLLRN